MRDQPDTDALSCHLLDPNFNVSRETQAGRFTASRRVAMFHVEHECDTAYPRLLLTSR